MYNHKKTNKTNKRKQKNSRKTKKNIKKQTKYLGGNETEIYTPKSKKEIKNTIQFYRQNNWDYEEIENSPKYKGPMGSWNVSNIKDMSGLFEGCDLLTEDLNDWDVSNVEDMSHMFAGCDLFNQPLDKWNVSNVKDMSYMFHECKRFNKNLNDWNVSNVENMKNMFFGCSFFNQPLDKWNVSNVTDMSFMFYNCKKFSQKLDSWKKKLGSIEEIINIFDLCQKFDKDGFIKKMYKETFETEDKLYTVFKFDYILYLMIIYNRYKNIENFTICDTIYLYNHAFDNYINGLLRNDNELKQKLNPKLLEFFEKIIHTIDNYFESETSPKSYKGMKLYRGENELCEDDTCRMGVISSYSSTSDKLEVAMAFTNNEDCCLYKYELDEGIPYIDVTKLMEKHNQSITCGTKLKLKNTEEFEIILPRGIVLNKIKEEETEGITTFMMSISYDENYIKNNPINF